MMEHLITDIHNNAKAHGWWDTPKSFGEIIALIHSELSEALEFYRNKDSGRFSHSYINYLHHYSSESGGIANVKTTIFNKPDGVLPELADVIIRIFDYVGSLDKAHEFMDILKEKHEYNKTRPFKHGGKVI